MTPCLFGMPDPVPMARTARHLVRAPKQHCHLQLKGQELKVMPKKEEGGGERKIKREKEGIESKRKKEQV